MTFVNETIDGLNGLTITECLRLLTAVGCEHDEVYAMAPGRGLCRLVCTTPYELSFDRPGNMLASACRVQFPGGPPNNIQWYWGSLLTFTADRLMRTCVKLSPPKDLRQPRSSSRETTDTSGRAGCATPTTDDDGMVYLWSSSGRTAVRGCTSHS